MLTKEEANELYKVIGFNFHTNSCCNACRLTGKLVYEIQNKIKELAEKSKREIQVGDIYKTFDSSEIAIVLKISEDLLFTSAGAFYKEGGIACYGTDLIGMEIERSHLNLDLSRRYKLVEIDDENA